jgi:hypothetical protein
MSNRSQLFLLPLSEAQPPRGALVFLLLLFPTYLPFAWLLLKDGVWDERRWVLLKAWPALPGFVVRSLVFLDGAPEWAIYTLMGVLTALVLLFLWQLGRVSYFFLVLAFCLAGLFSSWNAWMAYQAYVG